MKLRTVALLVYAGWVASCSQPKSHEAVLDAGRQQAFTIAGLLSSDRPELKVLVDREGANAGAVLSRRFEENTPVIERDVQRLYESVLTPLEMAALEKFYTSPEGKSISEKSPELLGRLALIGETYMDKALEPYAVDALPPND